MRALMRLQAIEQIVNAAQQFLWIHNNALFPGRQKPAHVAAGPGQRDRRVFVAQLRQMLIVGYLQMLEHRQLLDGLNAVLLVAALRHFEEAPCQRVLE